MIYLIGGPPRCGKTTAARQLAGVLNCCWVEGDWLTQAFSTYLSDDVLTPEERLFDLGPDVPRSARNDVLYSRFSADEIIGYYRAWAARSRSGLEAFIEYALHDREDMIVEGYQVDPALLPHFFELYPNRAEAVRAVFLVRDDEADIEGSIRRGTDPNDWVLTKTREEPTYKRIARMIARYSQVVRADAEREAFPVVALDRDFQGQMARAIELLRG